MMKRNNGSIATLAMKVLLLDISYDLGKFRRKKVKLMKADGVK